MSSPDTVPDITTPNPLLTTAETPASAVVIYENQRTIGRVKWFNRKSGFGFITIMNACDLVGKDIFVHFSNLRIGNQQYKYLVDGEYVEFILLLSEKEKHPYHAKDITGICEGLLMCQTLHNQFLEQQNYKNKNV